MPQLSPPRPYSGSNLEPLTEKQLRDAQRDKVYIFNVSPYEHTSFVEKRYTIPARKQGERVSEPLVIDGVVYTTISKGGELQWAGRDGAEVAQEIAGTFPMLHESQNLTQFGVFISDSPVASEEAIERATELWLERCSRKVAEGDSIASINNGVVDIGGGRTASNIGKDHRVALAELGQKRAWSGINVRMVECDQCGTANLPSAAMCKGCDAVFNEKLARERFPHKFSAEPRGPGRPRKEEAA